jgi:hypothetical protein
MTHAMAPGCPCKKPRRPHRTRCRRGSGFDPDRPAAEIGLAGEGTGQTENHPEVAGFIEPGTEGVLMVVAADAPLVAHGLKQISPTVAILVLHPEHFVAIGGVEITVLPCESHDLMLPLGKPLKSGLGNIGLVRAIHHPDFAPPGSHRYFTTGKQFHRADLQRRFGGRGKGRDRVVLAFSGRLDRRLGLQRTCPKQKARQSEQGFHRSLNFVFHGCATVTGLPRSCPAVPSTRT